MFLVLNVLKAADMNWPVQGGQPYWSFPLSKDSLSKGLLLFRSAGRLETSTSSAASQNIIERFFFVTGFTTVIYNCNDSTIVIYDRNESGQHYKLWF